MKHRITRITALICALLLSCASAEMALIPENTAEAAFDMLAVDHRLYELGYRDGACNGILDEITTNALINFQTANGLEATGEPNELTVSILLGENAISQARYLENQARENGEASALANGSYGSAVEKLQNALHKQGYFTGASDGAYGAETEAAVCRFQMANGLNETGIADSALFLRLYEGESLSWDEFLQQACAAVGDSGPQVRRLQLWLKQKGYFTGECTGRFGDGTLQAVRRFQDDRGLSGEGDVDIETCAALYWDVSGYLRDRAALRRGETGADVEEFCSRLAALGYPAHGRFNMQTELALMQFQLANRIKVTGVADELTMVRLKSENAARMQDYEYPASALPDSNGLSQRIVRQASALLGQYSELDSCFGFVQYVALKCGIALMDRAQLAQQAIGAADTIEPGTFLMADVNGREICGIATSDRAMIYRADSGYIVMGYLEAMDVQNLYLYHVIENM